MNHLKKFFHFFLFSFLILINACETLTEKNDDCDKTKWQTTQEPVMYVSLSFGNAPCDQTVYDHRLYECSNAICEGKITKIYCSGQVSGSFDISTTFYLDQIPVGQYANIKIGQLYQFKFANDNDYLMLQYHVKAYFNDGNIYETAEVTKRIYFKDLKTDINTMEKYFLEELDTYYILWHKVTT